MYIDTIILFKGTIVSNFIQQKIIFNIKKINIFYEKEKFIKIIAFLRLYDYFFIFSLLINIFEKQKT